MRKMVESDFSKAKFEDESLNEKGESIMSLRLQEAVLLELNCVLRDSVADIVSRLNKCGHNLKLYTPEMPGDLSYRDDASEDGVYRCDLRLGVDLIVSVGFRDAVDEV